MGIKQKDLQKVKQQIKYRLQNDDLDGIVYCDLQQTSDGEAAQAMILGATTFDLAFIVSRIIKEQPNIIPLLTKMMFRDDEKITFNNYDFGGETND